ncbi:MAG: protein kinase [Chloroflexi bacterium]|nr:protein kinase [Chloroflexota bacterium]
MQPNLVGQKLGKYTIREMLGMGGMGAVYRAHQDDLRRDVALKVISPNFAAQEELVARFIREAQTAASLEHAHIVPIYDYGVITNQLFIVMRLLTGGTLSQRIEAARKTGRLPSASECAALLDQLSGALDYAHARGVVHRDIKPGNIMFDNHGDAFLVDFGIAKAGDSTNLTRGSSVIGSPHYMAPEQWRGDPATAETDQYALAVVLFTMLTGKLPFEAETPYAVMQLHINTPPPSPTVFRADLPPALGLVMERALAKDTSARFPSVRAFAEAFRQAVGERASHETGFFTRPIEVTRTTVLPSGTGSRPGTANPVTSGTSPSQSLSQTIRQQRVGLAVGLGAGLIIAVVAGVLLLMQSRGAADVSATQTAQHATQLAVALVTPTPDAGSATPLGSVQLLTTPTDTASQGQAGATNTSSVLAEPTQTATLPPTETSTLPPTDTPSATATPLPTETLTPSPTATPTLSPEQIAEIATESRAVILRVTATEEAALTQTSEALAAEAAGATQAAETAAAQAIETQQARATATWASIATNAFGTLQAEEEGTRQALSVAATLDAIVRSTRAANLAAEAATAAMVQATLDAQTAGTAAALATLEAQSTQQAVQTANALETQSAQAAGTAAAIATLEAHAAETAAAQTAIAQNLATAEAATAAAQTAAAQIQTTASAATATRQAELAAQETANAVLTAQAAVAATAQAALAEQLTATAGGVAGTMDALNARATALRATATARAANALTILEETQHAVETLQGTLTAAASTVIARQTSTPGGVAGTMDALNARATALRITATARAALATPTVPPRVPPSPTPMATATATLFPTATQPPVVEGPPGILSPGDSMQRQVLTTRDDGFIQTIYLCCAAHDVYVEVVFEAPNTAEYWDFGIAVREQEASNQELRFYIANNRTWRFDLGAQTQMNGSHSAPFETRAGSVNRLTLVAIGRTGIALLNGEVIAVLDFSAIVNSGDLYVGTEFADGSPPGVNIPVVSINTAALDSAFGPLSGTLPHQFSNNRVETSVAGSLRTESFIARGVLDVPYALSQNSWDIGFDFRKASADRFSRLIVDAQRQSWYLYDFDREFELLESGPVGNLRQGVGDSNELILIAARGHGYLIVNGQPAARFSLPEVVGGGQIELGTGFFTGNEIDGRQTSFDDFEVWTFADQP